MITRQSVTVILRFAVVGGLVMLVFMGLNAWWAPRVGLQLGFLLSYVPAVALHFWLNKVWTFGCERQDRVRQVSDYLTMVALTFVIQWVVFTALTRGFACPPWLAAGAANLTQMAVSFLMMQKRVFARRLGTENEK